MSKQEPGSPALSAAELSRSPTVDTVGALPALYGRWLEAVLPGQLPVEIEATCSDCAMCRQQEISADQSQLYFDRYSKCCTYSPSLPNFMVGGILEDSTLSMKIGKKSLLARLKKEPGVNPLALLPPPVYSLLYRNSPNSFGRNDTLRCPHLDTSTTTCAIWLYREPTCISWFCKHVRGKIGQDFWKSLQSFLTTVSNELSLWCLLQLQTDSECLVALQSWRAKTSIDNDLQPNELDSKPDSETARKIWGSWWGRETEYFRKCYRLVNGLGFDQLEKICGPELQLSTQLIQQAYSQLQQGNIPVQLRVGGFEVTRINSNSVRIWSYSRLDPLDLPMEVFKALSSFDGRSTSDVLSALQKQMDTNLDTPLLWTLIDFGILEAS